MEQSFDARSGFKKAGQDRVIEDRLTAFCEQYAISPLEAARHFPVIARRQWLKRFLAHVELFKMTLDVPGDIAELGVFRGMGLMTWANLLETYVIGDRTKTVWGFDNWTGFTALSAADGAVDSTVGKEVGGFSPHDYKAELIDAIAIFDEDRFVSWKPRIKLVEGNIEETVGSFVEKQPGVRFSLIHFDCDLYEPTLAALKAFWPKLSRGGLMIFDEYAIPDWPGETRAVDEFLADKPDVQLRTFTWTNVPGAYLVKP